jgi:DNA-binding IclR family transcriptional regulator
VKGSRPRDWLLLGVLFPIWAVWFAASLSSIGDPPLIPLVSVRAGGAGEYPIVVDLSRWVRPGETDLAPDDRLVRVGSADLRGVGALEFWARFQVEAEYGRPVSLAYERGGQRGETQLPVHIRVPFGLHLPLACAAVGLLLSLRAPASRLARAGLPPAFQQQPYSEATSERIDAEVRRIVEECHGEADRLLALHRAKLESLARALLERESLDAAEVHAAAGVP